MTCAILMLMNKFGIVFSGRMRSALLTLLGIWVIFLLATMCQQAIGAYIAGDGFDVTISDFWIISLVFFVPYFVTSGYMLHELAARLAFYRLIKRQIVIAEYQPPVVLSAIEAGLMLDNTFGLPELAALLKKLELAGTIAITDTPVNLTVTLLTTDGLNAQEASFIRQLFADSSTVSVNAGRKAQLLSAGTALAANTRAQLVAAGQLTGKTWITKMFRIIFNTFLAVAILVQSIWTIALIVSPHDLLTIGYPRYPMGVSEPLFMVGLIAVMIILTASGFYQKTLTNQQGLKNWRYVAGLRVYIEVVYKGRFYHGGAQTTTTSELRQFYPYAIALGVENEFTKRLERALLIA